jgi:hypothetical protein
MFDQSVILAYQQRFHTNRAYATDRAFSDHSAWKSAEIQVH